MLVVAGVFIAFALASSFLFPRYWPQFPGSRGLGAFVAGSLVLTVAMLLAVEFFAVEEEEAEAGNEPAAIVEESEAPPTTTETTEPPPTSEGPETQTIEVAATEFAYALSPDDVRPGVVVFRLHNQGQVGHDLAVDGPGVEEASGGEAKTPVIASDQTADLEIRLEEGTYELWCTVPGHRDAGMEVELEVA